MDGSEPVRDAAVTDLYHQHWRGLVGLAALMLGDRPSAEDVVQDAFTELYGRWEHLRDPTLAVTYLRSTVLNRSRSVLRRRRVALRHRQEHPAPLWAVENHAVLSEDRREVLQALTQLPTRRRQVLLLRFYLDLDDAEIAETLGISQGTVRSAASRGLAALGRILEGTR